MSGLSGTKWNSLPFTEAVADETGGNRKVLQRDYLSVGTLPVVDQGRGLIAGYTNDESAACKVKLPVVLFGDHTKEFKFVDFPFALGADGVKVLKPAAELDEKFLYHYLKQVRLPGNAGYSRHFKFLKGERVPLPPLPEQKRIAAILDKADEIRRKRQEAIWLTEELLRSAFLEMFGDPVTNPKGWEVRPFPEVVLDATGGNRKILQSDYMTEGPLAVVDQGQALIGGYTDDPSAAAAVELPAVLFGDHTKEFKWIDLPFALGADGVKILVPSEQVDPAYLYWSGRLFTFPEVGYSRHFKFLKRWLVPIPPQNRQTAFRRLHDQVWSSLPFQEDAARTTELLAASLAREAFTRSEG